MGEEVEVYIGANQLCGSGTEEIGGAYLVVWRSVNSLVDPEQFRDSWLTFGASGSRIQLAATCTVKFLEHCVVW